MAKPCALSRAPKPQPQGVVPDDALGCWQRGEGTGVLPSGSQPQRWFWGTTKGDIKLEVGGGEFAAAGRPPGLPVLLLSLPQPRRIAAALSWPPCWASSPGQECHRHPAPRPSPWRQAWAAVSPKSCLHTHSPPPPRIPEVTAMGRTRPGGCQPQTRGCPDATEMGSAAALHSPGPANPQTLLTMPPSSHPLQPTPVSPVGPLPGCRGSGGGVARSFGWGVTPGWLLSARWPRPRAEPAGVAQGWGTPRQPQRARPLPGPPSRTCWATNELSN